MKIADRTSEYCSGWASSSLCRKCTKWASKYEFVRDIPYSIVRVSERAPFATCKGFVEEKKRKSK